MKKPPLAVLFALCLTAAVYFWADSSPSKSPSAKSNATSAGGGLASYQLEQVTKERDQLREKIVSLEEEISRLTSPDDAPDANSPAASRRSRSKLKNASGANSDDSSDATGKSEGNDDPFAKSVMGLAKKAVDLNSHFQAEGREIPELQFLREGDWLNLAKTADFQTEESTRKSLSDVRQQAKRNFGQAAWNAVTRFSNANNGQFPSDPVQLQAYFDVPVDATALQRYAIVPPGTFPSLQSSLGQFIMSEKAPLDPQFDSHLYVGQSGYAEIPAGGPDPDTNWRKKNP